MNLRERIGERLSLMLQAKMISERTAAFCTAAVGILLEEHPDSDEDRLNMLITHLAMAADRMEKGAAGETAIGEEIFEAVKREACFEEALCLGDRILKDAPVEFTGTERDFLTIHLCHLLM